MQIAVIGASGMVGARVVSEALARGHALTATTRDPAGLASLAGRAEVRQADVFDPASVARAASGSEVAVAAIRPDLAAAGAADESPSAIYTSAIRGLVDGLSAASVKRVILVGGAGSLKVPPGVRLVDSPDFPERFRPNALAQLDGLTELQTAAAAGLAWCCICPPFSLAPGERTGRYRTGADYLLTDERGDSAISVEDFAVAIVDELEQPAHIGELFTVARQDEGPTTAAGGHEQPSPRR